VNEKIEYETFGPKWQKELMRHPKKELVEMLRGFHLEKQALNNLVKEFNSWKKW